MTKVLVTGAGGPAGIAVIRHLIEAGHHVVGVDVDPLSAGFALASEHALVPRSDDPRFRDAFPEVVLAMAVDAVISTVAEEFEVLSELDLAAPIWLPDQAAVEVCLDKAHFAEALEAAGVPTPATSWADDELPPGPWVVKPRWGRGSRDVFLVDDLDGVEFAVRTIKDPVVQERIDGEEFTADVLVDRDGQVRACAPRWRLGVRGGISVVGETFEDNVVADLCRDVVAAVGLTGPINVQGFVRPDGSAVCVEVNPRFSGGLSLTLASGCDIVGEYLRGILGWDLRDEHLQSRPGVTMSRYFMEVIR